MEDSSFQAIYTGAYIVVFIAALTTALYLFNGITDLADKSYEYGKITTGQTVIEAPSEEELILNDTDAVVYYMNYIKKDKYSSVPIGFSTITISDISGSDKSYKDLMNISTGLRNKKYTLSVTDFNSFELVRRP